MNMISTGAFLNEMDASKEQPTVAEKFAASWEKKNAKAARAGGVSLMALSLAACGGSSSTTTTTDTTTDTTEDTTPVVVEPVALSFTLTSGANSFTGGDGADTFTAATAAVLQSFDTLTGGAGTDTLVVTDTTDAFEGATGLSGTISEVEGLSLSTSGGVGTQEVSAGTAAAGSGEVITVTPTYATSAFTAHTITINGTDFATTSIGSNNTTAKLLGDSIATKIAAILGDAVTVGARDSSTGVFTITAKQAGQEIPDISISVTGGASSAAFVSTAAVGKTASVAAAPIQQITLGGTAASTDEYTVNYVSATGANQSLVYTGSTQGTAATAIATQINALHGSDIAAAAGSVVTITGEVGTALPIISVGMSGSSVAATATSSFVQNAATVVSAATTEKVFDVSGFAGDVSLTVSDDAIIKAGATADVTVNSSSGVVDIDGGATVNVTATGSVVVMGNKVTSAIVKTGTGTGDTVSIGATSGTAADTPILEYAKVTGGTTITVIDETGGTSAKTLTTVDLSGIGGTATLTGDAIATVNWSSQKTAQVVDVVNGSTTITELALNLDGVGYDADGSSVTSKIITDAKTLTIASNGSKSDIDVEGSSTATATVNVSGAADLALELDASTTIVKTLAAGTMTGDLTVVGLESDATSVTTGSGDDTFSLTATTKSTVVAGDGDDTVTIAGASGLDKGSSIDLGAGNDSLLRSGSGAIDTDDASTVVNAKITSVDGGDGVDTLAASLINAGNVDQFSNFEILGLENSVTLDTSLISGITGLEIISGGGTYTNVDLDDLLTVATTGMSGTTTLTFATADVSGAADSYTITFSEQNAAERTTDATSANVAAGTVVTAGVETINIVSGGVYTWNDITLGANDDAETVIITGASNLDIAFASGFGSTSAPATGVAIIDGSAATGDLSVALANVVSTTTGLEVKVGVGDDTVTTAAQVATITGGAGDNTFVVAGNAITASTTATAAEVVSELVTITDFKSGDSIDFIAGNTTGTLVASDAVFEDIDVSAATSLLAATAIAAAGGGADASNTDISVDTFEYNGDTYLLYDASTKASTDVDTGDILVKLTGTGYDFADATLDTGGVFTM